MKIKRFIAIILTVAMLLSMTMTVSAKHEGPFKRGSVLQSSRDNNVVTIFDVLELLKYIVNMNNDAEQLINCEIDGYCSSGGGPCENECFEGQCQNSATVCAARCPHTVEQCAENLRIAIEEYREAAARGHFRDRPFCIQLL